MRTRVEIFSTRSKGAKKEVKEVNAAPSGAKMEIKKVNAAPSGAKKEIKKGRGPEDIMSLLIILCPSLIIFL